MRRKLAKLLTPPGVAVYPYLNNPDRKYKAEGEFKVDLRLDPKDPAVKEFITSLEEHTAAGYQLMTEQEGKKKALKVCEDRPWFPEEDKEEELTGMVLVRCKMRHENTNQKTQETWTQRPALFDASGVPVEAKIGNGSTIRCSVEVNPFYTKKLGAGIQLRLKGVQIIKLVEFGQVTAETCGFGAVEGGFVAPEGGAESGVEDPAGVGAEDDGEDGDY